MKACGSLKSLPIARKIHAQLISTCLISSIFLQLIDDDYRVFCDIGPRYLFTYNTMINGGVRCLCVGNIKMALHLHGLVKKFYFVSDESIAKSSIDMHVKCGAVDYAESAFLRMLNPSLFCWKFGIIRLLIMFQKMPERDLVSWNTMISILTRHGFGFETLCTFIELWNHGFGLSSMLYATAFSARASVYDLEWGPHLHSRVVHMEPSLDVFVGSGLIDMYLKCGCNGIESSIQIGKALVTMYAEGGSTQKADLAFELMSRRNMISWMVLISAFSQAGVLEKPRFFFFFVSLLSGCSHSGPVTKGKHYFTAMAKFTYTCYFVCMVDLLGLSGLLGEAKKLIDEMPSKPTCVIWGALLGACCSHYNTKLAELVMRNLLQLDVKELETRKNHGCRWIEVDDRVNVFTMDDVNHHRNAEIYGLQKISEKIENIGNCGEAV
ncbi:DYW deaminase domain-containing protein [Citrus sinensis]|uniref:Pentatricopeptide repeat-containing protein n=1 Tax=Citrus clementina TaxID=85681 RepID=V4TAX5_CITCL|nr:hypothetical protein CICLE_v10003454mg [Citrus x clementina]KAH9694021.1 DYW deaminase domain-containing protein [Citrus sinensis]